MYFNQLFSTDTPWHVTHHLPAAVSCANNGNLQAFAVENHYIHRCYEEHEQGGVYRVHLGAAVRERDDDVGAGG